MPTKPHEPMSETRLAEIEKSRDEIRSIKNNPSYQKTVWSDIYLDHVDALLNEVERLLAELESVYEMVDQRETTHQQIIASRERVEKAEADLAQAREVIWKAADRLGFYHHPEMAHDVRLFLQAALPETQSKKEFMGDPNAPIWYSNIPIALPETPEQPEVVADVKCETCGGTGTVWKNIGEYSEEEIPCPDCTGVKPTEGETR